MPCACLVSVGGDGSCWLAGDNENEHVLTACIDWLAHSLTHPTNELSVCLVEIVGNAWYASYMYVLYSYWCSFVPTQTLLISPNTPTKNPNATT